MVAAGVVVAGCASVGGDPQATTTGPVITETSGNPWDLPIEQRPALFDPCTEIPIEEVEEAVGSPLKRVDDLENGEHDGLVSCGWGNGEVNFGLLSTWKSRDDYLADPSFAVKETQAEVGGRTGLRLSELNDAFDSTCLFLFFTSRGTVWVSLDLVTGLNRFKGQKSVKACDALDDAVSRIARFIPRGEFT